MRALGWIGLFGAAVAVLGALGGGLSPVLDSLGVGLIFALVFAGAVLLLALFARRWRMAVIASAVLTSGAAPLVPVLQPGGTDGSTDLRLLQHNLSFRNTDPRVAERIRDVDVATFQEVAGPSEQALVTLSAEGWAVQICEFATIWKMAVASRLPALSSGCLEDGGSWLRIDGPQGAVTIVSLHLHWPWPFRQREQVREIAPQLAALPQPVIVAGDFNQTPWSASVREVEAATGTEVVPGLRMTFHVRDIVPVPIDHVLIPEDWSGVAERDGFPARTMPLFWR